MAGGLVQLDGKKIVEAIIRVSELYALQRGTARRGRDRMLVVMLELIAGDDLRVWEDERGEVWFSKGKRGRLSVELPVELVGETRQ